MCDNTPDMLLFLKLFSNQLKKYHWQTKNTTLNTFNHNISNASGSKRREKNINKNLVIYLVLYKCHWSLLHSKPILWCSRCLSNLLIWLFSTIFYILELLFSPKCALKSCIGPKVLKRFIYQLATYSLTPLRTFSLSTIPKILIR